MLFIKNRGDDKFTMLTVLFFDLISIKEHFASHTHFICDIVFKLAGRTLNFGCGFSRVGLEVWVEVAERALN